MLLRSFCAVALALQSVLSFSTPRADAPTFPDLYEATIADLQAGLDAGYFTSVDLVDVNASQHDAFLSLTKHRPTLPELTKSTASSMP
jgi:hypothetical protein